MNQKVGRREIVAGLAAVGTLAFGGAGRRHAAAAVEVPVKTAGAQPANIMNYAPQMVALAKGFTEAEGLDFKIVVSGGGTKNRDMVASGQVDFGIGDATHALQMTSRGRPAKLLMAVDSRCGYVNIVIRKDLFDAGVDTLRKFGHWQRPDGSKPILAVTTIGGGVHVYASFLLERLGISDKMNWTAGGIQQTMLGGLESKQFDAIVGPPSWQWKAEANGWGRTIYDVEETAAWDEAFGGNIPATAIYARRTTIDREPEKVQAYVNALYRGLQWMKAGSDEDVYRLLAEKYLNDIPVDIAMKEIAFYRKICSYSGLISPDDFKRAGEIWFRPMTEIKRIEYADSVDDRFIRAAQKKYGT
jgi:NitT/TauT family transport system substrate-binding protein